MPDSVVSKKCTYRGSLKHPPSESWTSSCSRFALSGTPECDDNNVCCVRSSDGCSHKCHKKHKPCKYKHISPWMEPKALFRISKKALFELVDALDTTQYMRHPPCRGSKCWRKLAPSAAVQAYDWYLYKCNALSCCKAAKSRGTCCKYKPKNECCPTACCRL